MTRTGFLLAALVLTGLLPVPGLAATPEKMVEFLLQAENPPDGVVFELLEGSIKDMDQAIARVQALVRKLRAKYPDLDIAVVSHGREEFALLSSNKDKYASSHTAVKQLLSDNVPVHVCGTHASWRGKNPEDFPDYVDVVPQGPDQLNEYVNLGYDLIVIR